MRLSTILISTLSAASLTTLAQPVVTQAAQLKPHQISVVGSKSERRIEGEYIVVFKKTAPKDLAWQLSEKINAEHRAVVRDNGQVKSVKSLSVINGFSGALTKVQLAALKMNPHVKSIEANQVVSLASYENPVVDKSKQESVARSLAHGAWSIDRTDQFFSPLDHTYAPYASGAGAHVYVIDSGIHTSHVGFEGRADWVFTASGVSGGNGDNNGHGTHLAGNIGSSSYGVAKQVNLHAVKVLDAAGTGTLAGLLEGIDYVTNHHQKPAVATIGFSTPFSTAFNDAVSASIAAGVTYAVPVGDEARDACDYSPSAVNEAIRIGAVWTEDIVSQYSNKGTCVDLYAPGLYVNSLWHTTDYATNTISHSPVAAAHAAGAAALLLGLDSSCTPTQVKTQIISHGAFGTLTGVPEGSLNQLLYVPQVHNPYYACNEVAPTKVYTDFLVFEFETKGDFVDQFHEHIVVNQPISEFKSAGVNVTGSSFMFDISQGVDMVLFGGDVSFDLDVGTNVFGFDVTHMTDDVNVTIRFADSTQEQHTISSVGLYVFETEKVIVGMDVISAPNTRLGNLYHSDYRDGLSIDLNSKQQYLGTISYPDLDSVITPDVAQGRLSGEQLDVVSWFGNESGRQALVTSIDRSSVNGEPSNLMMATSTGTGDFDVTIEFHTGPKRLGFNTYLSGGGHAILTVYSQGQYEHSYVINHDASEADYIAFFSRHPIDAIRLQAPAGSALAGFANISSDTAVAAE